MKYLKVLQVVGLIFGFISSFTSFKVFYKNVDKLNTPEEWRFYFSLAGFLIFLSMFLLLVITLIMSKFLTSKFLKTILTKFNIHLKQK